MNEILVTVLDYVKLAALSTGIQILVILGPLLILSFLMNLVAGGTEKLAYSTMGEKLFLGIFGWLGTTVHELGHALFCVLFRHKITEMKLFNPHSEDGSLGHVNHTYNPESSYQVIGNFFIGIGPILLGATSLFLTFFFLFEINLIDLKPAMVVSIDNFKSIDALLNFAVVNLQSALNILQYLWESDRVLWWKVLLFAYLLFSIGSSITLSKPDIEGAASGFGALAGILLFINLLTIWMGTFLLDFFTFINQYMSVFYFIMVMTIIMNIAFAALMGLILGIKILIRSLRNR